MNIRRIVFILVLQYLLGASPGVLADAQQATLVIPEALDILKVDTTKYKGKLFSTGDTPLKLGPGLHRIVVQYDVIWDITTEEHERVWSKPFQITFSAKAGKQYYIKLPAIDFLKQARKYADKPVIEIIDRSAQQLVAAKVLYHEDDWELFRFNDPSASAVSGPSANTAGFQQTGPLTTGNMPLMMLKYWWNQANGQQRQHFIDAIRK